MQKPANREQAALYYGGRLEEALQRIAYYRRTWGVPISFVSHPLSGTTPEMELGNILQLGMIINELSTLYNTIAFNQLVYHGVYDPHHDPQFLDIKFEIFYRGLVEACDQVFTVENYAKSKGCTEEVRFAQELGKPVYLLDVAALFEEGLPSEDQLPTTKEEIAGWSGFNENRLHHLRSCLATTGTFLAWEDITRPLH